MSVLHTVNKSPFGHASLASCLRLARPGASVLLIEDGVYAALAQTAAAAPLANAPPGLALYVLGPDLEARGMREARVIEGIQVIDHHGFVDLVVGHDTVQAWL